MTITKLIDKTKLPNPSQDQAAFDANFLQTLLDLSDFGGEVNAERDAMNALAAGLNTIAAGGAYALPYVFDTGTAASDPGSSRLRLNSGTQNLATAMYVDVVAGVLGDVSALLASFNQSTNPTKGRLRLVKMGDATKFMTFNVTGVTNSTGYFTLVLNSGAGSSASPFGPTDSVVMYFDRNGDIGPQGPVYTHPVLYVREEQPSGTSGGSATTSTWMRRTLNTARVNTISGASLSGNQITLPAGTYEFCASAPACAVDLHKARLYNVTNLTASDWIGTSESAANPYGSSRSTVKGRFTIGAAVTFELQHWTSTNNGSYSLGYPTGSGAMEIYSELEFRKVA